MQVSLIAGLSWVLATLPAMAASPFDDCEHYRGNGLVHDRLERPAPPACIRFPIAIADGASYSACRSEIRLYRARIDGYLKCLKWEADASTDEYNDAVRSFNRLSE